MNRISSEMLAHIGLCSHPKIKNILVINSNEELIKEINKHQDIEITTIDSDIYNSLSSSKNDSFDIVIANSIKDMSDATIYAQINRVLNNKGIFIIEIDKNYYKDIDEIKEILKVAGEPFIIAMPFTYEGNSAVFCSKKYHPTADLILQKSDLLEDLEYYNCDIHLASFTLPTAIKKSIIKVLKH